MRAEFPAEVKQNARAYWIIFALMYALFLITGCATQSAAGRQMIDAGRNESDELIRLVF